RDRVHAVAGRQHSHTVALEQTLRYATHRNGVVDDKSKRPPVLLLPRDRRKLPSPTPLRAHQGADVQDDDDTSITEDRGSGNAPDSRDLRADRLHHDLTATDELVGN